MQYLIFKDNLDAIERNHENRTARTWPRWVPQTIRDTPYHWNMQMHPSSGEVALQIPDEDADLEAGWLDANEIADLDTELTPDWTPEEV